MAKQIPTEFSFMNQTWRIRPAMHNELKDSMGQCDPMTNTIIIDPTLPSDVLLQTIMHEILHTWEITLQLDMPDRTVDLMALCLIHFFKSNPQFAGLFMEFEDDNPTA